MSIERLLDLTDAPSAPEDLYDRITFPAPGDDRPYVFINMVSTLDGKIVIGDPGGSAKGLGGPSDQVLFRRLQRNADGALVGGNTLRASQVIYPPEIARFVVTRTGDLPLQNRFFTDAPDRAFVIAPKSLSEAARVRLKSVARLIETGEEEIDWKGAMTTIRRDLNVLTLLCEGGSQINWQVIHAGLADELFLTLAPKLKGGSHLPTIVSGEGFPPGFVMPLDLLSVYHDGGEIYLRYSIAPQPRKV